MINNGVYFIVFDPSKESDQIKLVEEWYAAFPACCSSFIRNDTPLETRFDIEYINKAQKLAIETMMTEKLGFNMKKGD